jgi:hypothetical protein
MVLGLLTAAAPQAFRLATVQVRLAEKVHPQVVALLRPSLFYSGLILVALGFFGRSLTVRRTGKTLAGASLVLLGLTVPLLLVRWIEPLRIYAATSSSRGLARTILESEEKDLPLYGYYCFRPSLPFYLRRPVGLVTTDASELTSNYVSARLPELRRQPPRAAPSGPAEPVPLLMDGTDLRARAHRSPQAVLVLVRNRDVQKLAQTIPEMEPLWNEWEYSVWKVPVAKPQ